MTVPFAFANLSGNIALAKLDSNFNTPITIGNTSVLLGNTITTINNVTLANVTISSGTASNISLTSPLAVSSGGTGSANLTVNNVLIGNGTSAVTSVAPGTTGNVLTSIGGAWVSNVALTSVAAGSNTQVQYNSANLLAGSANLTFDGTNLGLAGGTATGVAYLNGSKVLTTGSALTFDGTGLSVTGSTSATLKLNGRVSDNASSVNFYDNTGATRYGFLYFDPSIGGQIATTNANPLAFAINSSEQMRLTSTGLGIGTSSPAQKLDVVGGRTFLTTSGNDPFVLKLRNPTYTNGVYLGNPAENTLGFFNNAGTEQMRLDSSGNLLVGSTSSTGAFSVNSYARGWYLSTNHATGVNADSYSDFLYAGTKIGSITQDSTTGVLYNITSDQRLKENIQDSESASDLIDAIQVRQYDWKSNGSRQRYGFVAQELVTVAPEAVNQPADSDEMMGVDYSKLVPMLVKEIQSLRIRIAQLEAKP